MTRPIPRRLVAEQWPTALAMAAGGAWSLLPFRARDQVQGTDRVHTARVRAGSDRNLDAFAVWAGAPPERYAGVVPPTSAARWAMPMVARLSSMAPHSLLKVVNQGVRLRVDGELPRGPLDLAGQLVEVREDDGRVRIHTRVEATAGDAATPAVTLDALAAVVTGRRHGTRASAVPEPDRWERVGSWSAADDDGRAFFRLTGDFNPIHTSRTFARRTRFRGPILHGFASFARTSEVLVDALGSVADLEVRFVTPVPIPTSQVHVEVGDDARHVRLIGDDGTVHLAGSVQFAEQVHDATRVTT